MLDFVPLVRYPKERLRQIVMPIGGIGTGSFALSGMGALTDWQLMSRPHRGWRPPLAHLLLWVRTTEGDAYLRVLEGILHTQLDADSGAPQALAGIPRMRATGFEAAYPFGRARLEDPLLPLRVSLTGFNPLIPESLDDSSLPMGLLQVQLAWRGSEPAEAALTFVLTNFIGSDGVKTDLKGNLSEVIATHGWKGVLFRKADPQPDPCVGTLCLLCDDSAAHVARRWAFQHSWGGKVLGIIDHLLREGVLPDAAPEAPCPPSDERGWDSSVSTRFTLHPHQPHTARFLLTWHFPYRDLRELGWFEESTGKSPLVQNAYAQRFRDAVEVAEKVIPRLESLWEETHRWVSQVCRRKLPLAFKESALNTLTVLRSPTLFAITDSGRVHFLGFEGCNATTGCCHGSCTHVWNYEQATVSLFPQIHGSMLESHLEYGITEDGAHRFRLDLPLGANRYSHAAADGQMGTLVRIYQHYRRTRDRAWLKRVYPKAQQMLAFAWVEGGWDADQDGVMEGAQHNTHDVEFFGPNPLCGVWYLAALRACEEMARVLGDTGFQRRCRNLFEQGSDWIDTHLFNGEYYIQQIRRPQQTPHPMTCKHVPPDPLPYQIGNGCQIDQLAGQYKANRAGLGDLLKREHIISALRSIMRYNWRQGFHAHYNHMRTYALGDEAGVIICSYPYGRPEVPLPYAFECWTGLEYLLARLLRDYGLHAEAERVVRAVRARHDGRRRNPFNEPECGSFYARAMAAWALVE